jgi:hypothetical protein
VEETAIRMSAQVDEIDKQAVAFWEEADREQVRIQQLRENLNQVELELATIQEQLRKDPNEEISSLQKRLDEIEAKIDDLNREQGANQQEFSHLKTAIDIQALQLSQNSKQQDAKTLIQVPLNIEYAVNQILLNGGVTPVLKNDKLSVLPEILLSYKLPETSVKVKAGVHNELNINSMYKLNQINPFILPVDTLTIFQEQQYFAGFDLHSSKGLQLSVKTGYSQFKNQPLFINNGAFGNELKVLNESSLSALMLDANLTYIFSNNLKFSSGLKGYSFQKQSDYDEAYGLLPLELLFRLDWEPLEQLKTRFTTVLWSGTMSKTGNNTDIKSYRPTIAATAHLVADANYVG